MGINAMNKLLLLLLLIPATASALSKSELDCGAKMVYHEGRGLSPKHWDKIMKVAVNRKKHPKKYGAKSTHLCDIVRSSQYTTHKKLNRRPKEIKRLNEIVAHLRKGYWQTAGNEDSFHSRHGHMTYYHS